MICYGLFYHSGALNSGKLLGLGFTLLALTAACHGKTVPFEEKSSTHSNCLGSAVMDLMDGPRRCMEYVVGPHATETFFAFVEMVLRVMAEGAASGLNVIAVYVSEILRATGVVDPVFIPHFTSEGVFLAAKWALIAIIGYWLLCIVLRVAIALLKRIFWLLKVVVVAWLFTRIINESSASPDAMVARLALLVVVCAALSVTAGAVSGKDPQWMEKRLKNLEERVQVLENTKKWSDD